MVDMYADACAYFFGLQHHRRDKTAHQLVAQDQVGGGAGQRADRIDGHVAPELEPDVFLDLFGHRGFEAGFLKQRGELPHAFGFLARRLADDELVAKVVVHLTRLVE